MYRRMYRKRSHNPKLKGGELHDYLDRARELDSAMFPNAVDHSEYVLLLAASEILIPSLFKVWFRHRIWGESFKKIHDDLGVYNPKGKYSKAIKYLLRALVEGYNG